MDFPNLPHIIDGDFKVSETCAVHQYIAHKYKPELLGRNPAECAKVAQMWNVANDTIFGAMGGLFGNPSREENGRVFIEKLGPLVASLGNNKWLVNNNLSIIDFMLFEFIEMANALCGNNKAFSVYPTLQAYHERVRNLPGMKQYYEGPNMRRGPFVPPFAACQF